MPFRLQAHADFFDSHHAPAMCLFSGRIDQVGRQPLFLRTPAASGLTRCLPILAPRTALKVPCAPGALFYWRFCSRRAFLPLLAGLLLAGLIFGLYHDPLNPTLSPLIAVGVAVLGALLTSILLPLARRDCIRLGLTSRASNLTIIFPSSREHVFWAYQKAYQTWLAAQPSGLYPTPGASGSQPVPSSTPAA